GGRGGRGGGGERAGGGHRGGRRKERQPADDQDHADDQADEQAAGGRKRAGRRRDRLFFRERAGDRHGRDDHPEAADQHRDGAGDVIKESISAQSGEGGPVGAGRRLVSHEPYP